MEEREKPSLSCPFCSRQFVSSSAYDRHLAAHQMVPEEGNLCNSVKSVWQFRPRRRKTGSHLSHNLHRHDLYSLIDSLEIKIGYFSVIAFNATRIQFAYFISW